MAAMIVVLHTVGAGAARRRAPRTGSSGRHRRPVRDRRTPDWSDAARVGGPGWLEVPPRAVVTTRTKPNHRSGHQTIVQFRVLRHRSHHSGHRPEDQTLVRHLSRQLTTCQYVTLEGCAPPCTSTLRSEHRLGWRRRNHGVTCPSEEDSKPEQQPTARRSRGRAGRAAPQRGRATTRRHHNSATPQRSRATTRRHHGSTASC